MNLFFSCNKCESCSDKDVSLNFNKKGSINSFLNKNKKADISKDDILSNDSTNNLEIIDYPYHVNFNDNFISQSNTNRNGYEIKVPQRNYYLTNINKIEKLPSNKLDNSAINNNNNINNSLSDSSLILNNDESFLKNKALLSNYYANYENLKNKKMKMKLIPHNKPKTGKKLRKKFVFKIGMDKNNSDIILAKKSNKSNRKIFKLKQNKEKKILKTEINGVHPKVKKCKTNFSINLKNNEKTKNINTLNTKNILDRINYMKNRHYVTYNKCNKKEIIDANKKPKNISIKIYRYKKMLKNYSYKNCSSINKKIKKEYILPIIKFSNSSEDNKQSFKNKNNINICRKTTNSTDNNKINLNFSYLLPNKKDYKDNHYLSKSYINPFGKI